MLDELREIREIQLAQGRALADGDTDGLDALDARRMEVQARIVPHESEPMSGADLAEAQALLRLIAQDQDELAEKAAAAREMLGDELRELSRGRVALAGYRPVAGGHSVLLDRAN